MRKGVKEILVICGILLILALFFSNYRLLMKGFTFKSLANGQGKTPRESVAVPKADLHVSSLSGAMGEDGYYRYSGEVRNVSDRILDQPIISLEFYDQATGEFLHRDKVVLQQLGTSAPMSFNGAVRMPASVKSITISVEVLNYPYVIRPDIELSARW